MERCPDHGNLAEEVKTTRLAVVRMEESLKNAIQQATDHIQGGARWRLTIACACVGLVGTFVGGVVRFSVMEYKLNIIQADQSTMRTQIYDLNYEKGRLAGIAENGK